MNDKKETRTRFDMSMVKPCPFCGKKPHIRHKGEYASLPYYVYCNNANCKTKPEGWHCDTLYEAIACWNNEFGESECRMMQ